MHVNREGLSVRNFQVMWSVLVVGPSVCIPTNETP